MSFKYEILADQRAILVCFWGKVIEATVISASMAISKDRAYEHGFDGIIDLREVDSPILVSKMQTLVDYALSKQKHGWGRWAVIVDTPAATAYAVLYHRNVASKHPFEIFCSVEGAVSSLGLERQAARIESFFGQARLA